MLRSKPLGFAPAVLRGFSVASSPFLVTGKTVRAEKSFQGEGATKSAWNNPKFFLGIFLSGVTRSRLVQNLDFFSLFYPAVQSQIETF